MVDESDNEETRGGKARKRRIPRKVSKSHLENVALHYLERFASSSQNLKNVLMRRVHRSAHFHGTDPEEGMKWIDEIIERYLDSGLLDDRAYTDARVRSLHGRGNSRKSITMKLRAKGIQPELVNDALETLSEETEENLELVSAIRFAKRRRLGPFREAANREEHREKDLAALARAGFSYDIAQQVIEAEDIDQIASKP